MKILIFLKEIPPEEERNLYQDIEGIGDSDKNVLTEALNLRDQEGGTVTAMVLGPAQGEKTAREALTWGVDRSVLVLKEGKTAGDIRESARVLAKAIEEEGAFDLVLCGRQAIDGDAAHMAAMTAFFLDIPLIAYSKRMETENGQLYNWCAAKEGTERTKCNMPALVLSVKEDQKIRHPNVCDIMSAYAESTVIPVIKPEQDVREQIIRQTGEYLPEGRSKQRKILNGKNDREKAELLYQVLKKHKVPE
ncbi:electron transfer flavoprotein subunit beta/FixA family protein [Anaerostipes sp.]|uniref:electron transfer flavoprotein subunit beta/FixA family protein n=1 Tax=Anaerostipes sp. TaxID=1872530 RepID=UPI0025C1AF9D|nr:electron transfer flavoprotein subunit beta/FixA family protein [Anaerostipes sp.]MBS7009624.1 electron transfer flavoprotein subunit beta/FixA family protein [Anaerostipes sp.]